jgi:hypothetical protein
VDPLPRLILHHPFSIASVLEIGAILAVAAVLALVWWRGRRRQADRRRAVARMREGDRPDPSN